MKTKTLLLTIMLFATLFSSIKAQQLLISEDFSSAEWDAEFLAQDATYLKPSAGSVFNFLTPITCFGKYVLTNSPVVAFDGLNESTNPTNVCAVFSTKGIVHDDNNGLAIAIRFKNNGTTSMEFPEIASAGEMTIHVKNGNPNVASTIDLEKWDSELETWSIIYSFPLANASVYLSTSLDEVLSYSVNSAVPIKLRLSGSDKNNHLFRVDVEEYNAVGIKNPAIEGDFIISPNPVENYIQIQTSAHDYFVDIYNIEGKKLISGGVNAVRLDISALKSGIYLISLEKSGKKSFHKFIKK